jgi:hypothetical protein
LSQLLLLPCFKTPITGVLSSGRPEGLGHVLRWRLGHVLDEGGAPTVSSYSSFWRVECRRVLGCSTGWRESCVGGLGLILTGGFTRTERCHPAGNGGRGWFPVVGHELAGEESGPRYRWSIDQQGSVDNVHTFRPGLARRPVGLARIPHVSATSQCFQGLESRSSPTSGTAYPLVRGGFALMCVHSGWSGPSDTGRGVCLAPRAACLIVGERVQGYGWLALRLL